VKDALKIGGLLIGTYLLVYYATGAGRVIGASGQATTGVIKAFQGRG
jgi:hypothetical protein